MKISILAWDADFRESLHTVDFFADQDLDQNDYEFLWVDYYQSNDHVRKKVSQYANTRLITLDHDKSRTWHLGQCINAGAAQAKGDLLVIPDGDIAVEKDFLSSVLESHQNQMNLVTYHKRYDEPKEAACRESKTSIEHLKKKTRLINPTNYAGCLALHRDTFDRINGYEAHAAFAGPGINGMETYIRLRNAGCLIKWEPAVRIYHPWHPSSGSAGHNDLKALKEAKSAYPWIIPYAGLQQSWIIHRREVLCETRADEAGCDRLLEQMPGLDTIRSQPVEKRSRLGNFMSFLRN